jgi:hypothetical protein
MEPFVRSGHTKRASPGTGRRTEKEKWRHLWGGLWGENSSAQKFESRQRSMADDGSAHFYRPPTFPLPYSHRQHGAMSAFTLDADMTRAASP